MYFRDYNEQDANTIIKWIRNEKELKLWGADRYKSFPICADEINNNYTEAKKVSNFYPKTLEKDGNIIGHIILRNPEFKNQKLIRLGFIIVDPNLRGKGYGKILINNAIDFARKELNASEITLGVFYNNESALKCYESVGFKKLYIEKEALIYKDEKWDIVEMKL